MNRHMYFRQQEKNDELYHHGIKGQRWGIRRYQNEDGSLTPEGRERYGLGDGNFAQRYGKFAMKYTKPSAWTKPGELSNDMAIVLTGVKTKKEREAIKKDAERKYKDYERLCSKAEELEQNNYDENKIDSAWDKANKAYEEYKYMKKGISPDEMKYINDSVGRLYNGPHYDEKHKKMTSGSKSFDAMMEENEHLANKIYDKHKNENIKYASKEWFEAREELYKEQEKLEKKYADSVLKDFGIKTKDPIIKKEIYNLGKNELLYNSNTGYAWHDNEYASIADPWGFTDTAGRDYGLENTQGYKEFYSKRRTS